MTNDLIDKMRFAAKSQNQHAENFDPDVYINNLSNVELIELQEHARGLRWREDRQSYVRPV